MIDAQLVDFECPGCGEWCDTLERCSSCKQCELCCECDLGEFDDDELGIDPEEELDYRAETDVEQDGRDGGR